MYNYNIMFCCVSLYFAGSGGEQRDGIHVCKWIKLANMSNVVEEFKNMWDFNKILKRMMHIIFVNVNWLQIIFDYQSFSRITFVLGGIPELEMRLSL